LLLDEPFQGLDPESRAALRCKFRELIATRSVRAVMTTHDLAEADAIADHTPMLGGLGDCVLRRNRAEPSPPVVQADPCPTK
jgi:ABC-type nitrate/sulfonate/bicarbonate transport system ATPase subunit